VPVDPGRHEIVAQAPGHETWRSTVVVLEGEIARIEIPALVASTPPPKEAVASGPTVQPAAPAFPAPAPVEPSAPALPVAALPPDSTRSHAGQVGLAVRTDIDGQGRGALVAVGPTYGIGDRFEVLIAALIGHHPGAYLGGTVFVLKGSLKPAITAGMPVYVLSSPYFGVHAAGGLVWDPSRHFGVFGQAGAEYFPNVPREYKNLFFVPTLGVQGRL
jgi:hypothetical protein